MHITISCDRSQALSSLMHGAIDCPLNSALTTDCGQIEYGGATSQQGCPTGMNGADPLCLAARGGYRDLVSLLLDRAGDDV